jgi:hypothetical protein
VHTDADCFSYFAPRRQGHDQLAGYLLEYRWRTAFLRRRDYEFALQLRDASG